MSRQLITALIVAGLALSLLVVIVSVGLGWGRTLSYAGGLGRLAVEAADDASPISLEIARTRSLLDAERGRVDDYEDKVLDLQVRAEAADREAARLADREDELMATLAKAQAVLADGPTAGGEHYVIADRQYHRDDVERDAERRLEALLTVRAELAFRRQLAEELHVAAAQGRQLLADARQRQGQVARELERLELRSQSADARAQAGELAAAVAKLPAEADSGELRRAMANLERRVSRDERHSERAGPGIDNGVLAIDYSGRDAKTGSLIDRLAQELGDRPEARLSSGD